MKTGTVALEKALRAVFMKAYGDGANPNEISPFILDTMSTGADEKYGWLGQSPAMSEWVDERKLKGLLSYSYTLPNKRYEATISVDQTTIEDDRLGMIDIRIKDMSEKAKNHPRKLFFNALKAGQTALCYDGQPFFNASHIYYSGGSTQSNLITGTGTTVEKVSDDFNSAKAKLRGFKDEYGDPWNDGAMDNLWVVGPAELESVFDKVFKADMISNTTNTLKSKAMPLVSSYLTDSNDWYLICGGGVVRPFVKQTRKNISFKALEGSSAKGFMSGQFLYGVDYRIGFGYGLWERAIKITNS